MKGFIGKSVAWCLAVCLPAMGGCNCYRELVDPCWPERWNAVARHSVNDHFDAQALNGHIADQTLWNFHFKTMDKIDPETRLAVKLPTGELNYAGQMHLQYLVRRLPGPDGKIYLNTARDSLPPATPIEQIAEKTNELNTQRIAAIHKYLAVLTTGYNRFPVNFTVEVHDRPEPTFPALPISGAMRPNPTGSLPDFYNQFFGSIPANQLSATGGTTAP